MINNATNTPEFSVTELSLSLKRTVEDAYSYVRVRGEISGFKRAASGHLYMALKDADSVIDAVCWRGQAGKLDANPEDGLEVIATGRLTTYPGRSKYQIVIERMEIAGEGALLKLLEDRRLKLTAEGLFDVARKKPIPYLPNVIGIVTSPTGAVIRDIMHRLNDRFPRHVLVWPTVVQGAGAADKITAAIDGFNKIDGLSDIPRPDLIIVARGGGSLEDLWCFNEENVVRAAAASAIPLISAVGHETDTTLIDFASDARAPTPTAAAEMAVPVRADLLVSTIDLGRRGMAAINRQMETHQRHVENLSRGLPKPDQMLSTANQRLDDYSERLTNGIGAGLDRRVQQIALLASRLLSPAQILESQMAGLKNLGDRLNMALNQAQVRADTKFTAANLGERLQKAGDRLIVNRSTSLEQLGRNLENLSYKNVLQRGFAVVRNEAGEVVKKSTDAETGHKVSITFGDKKSVDAIVGLDNFVNAYTDMRTPKPTREAKGRAKPKKETQAKKTPTKDDRQGGLF